MQEAFIRERITQLRLKKGVSEYQMSYDLGHSRGYVYNISSGKALPPMKEFLAICDYFGITPQEFFDTGTQHPELIQKAVEGLRQLDETDLLMILSIINRLKKQTLTPLWREGFVYLVGGFPIFTGTGAYPLRHGRVFRRKGQDLSNMAQRTLGRVASPHGPQAVYIAQPAKPALSAEERPPPIRITNGNAIRR